MKASLIEGSKRVELGVAAGLVERNDGRVGKFKFVGMLNMLPLLGVIFLIIDDILPDTPLAGLSTPTGVMAGSAPYSIGDDSFSLLSVESSLFLSSFNQAEILSRNILDIAVSRGIAVDGALSA